MESKHYDAVIIGAGQGGAPLAMALAAEKWKTALIERRHVGGSCINFGCTPTKTMIASAKVAYLARRSADYGIHTGAVHVNMKEVRERKRQTVERFRASKRKNLEQTQALDMVKGEASFTGPKSLLVHLNDGGSTQITAEKIFIDTGTRPKQIPIDGIDSVTVLDEAALMELDELPSHLLILGGGYIGLEFGQMFCRFGSQVTIIESGEQLASHEDRDIADAIADILREDGIQIYLQSKAKRVHKNDDGSLVLTTDTPDGEITITGSHLLMAVGRAPNTEKLNLQAAGIHTDENGYIRVNDRLETSSPGIYAIGDVKGGPAFTHISYDDYRVLRTNLLENGSASIKNRVVPYTMFIDPQLGRVGLTEQQARKQGHKIKVANMSMSRVARAIEMSETRGLMKIVVDAETEHILGCAVLGVEGGEIMSVVQMAMIGNLSYRTLQNAVFAHPTLAEALNNAFYALSD